LFSQICARRVYILPDQHITVGYPFVMSAQTLWTQSTEHDGQITTDCTSWRVISHGRMCR